MAVLLALDCSPSSRQIRKVESWEWGAHFPLLFISGPLPSPWDGTAHTPGQFIPRFVSFKVSLETHSLAPYVFLNPIKLAVELTITLAIQRIVIHLGPVCDPKVHPEPWIFGGERILSIKPQYWGDEDPSATTTHDPGQVFEDLPGLG